MNSKPPKTLADWLTYLENQHHTDIELTLDRIYEVGSKLDLIQTSAKTILIAGTNGKGSTSRFLEAFLLNQRYSVGVFNSPHLYHYNETVRVNSAILADETHINAFSYLEQNRGETTLTAFEFATLAALKIFKDKAVDFVIMEVGLGGRGDATNIIDPDVSVLTTIDLDHQAWLGNDRETIGFEKAGIFRAQKPAIVGDFDIPKSVLAHAQSLNCQLVCANQDFSLTDNGHDWHWQSGGMVLEKLMMPKIPMQNVSTALATLQKLDIPLSRESVNVVLLSLVVEGRFEVISSYPLIIVDVAHNPQAARYLASQLAKYRLQGSQKITAVVGMLKDKEIHDTLSNIAGEVDQWYLADLNVARGAKALVLAEQLETLGISEYSCFDGAEKALEQAKSQQQSDELIIVFGSFHTIAAALKNR